MRSNCFKNLERLERWVGGTGALTNGQSPESGFAPIPPGTIGQQPGEHVVVLVHGWAPGYRSNVEACSGRLKWWCDGTGNSSGVWPSAWAWVPTTTTGPVLPVTLTGVFQEFQKPNPVNNVVPTVLGFSWTDDSATGGSFLQLDQVYQSEAYTNINGLRLADALEDALSPLFWNRFGSVLHIVGHSHGSKVATVAALTLQQRGRKVNQLTILDSPESKSTLSANGANLLGFYLEQLSIQGLGTGQTFVDSYVSEFGVGFEGGGSLANLVEVMLDPSQVYSVLDPGDEHSYSAAWYGGAAAAVKRLGGLPPLGVEWPPPPTGARQNPLNQLWNPGVNEREQWVLTSGPAIDQVRRFRTETQPVTNGGTTGNVTFTNQVVTLHSLSGNNVTNSSFRGGYRTASDQFGVAFDLQWLRSQDGGYVVITAEAPEERTQEVLVVLDGKSMPLGQHPMSFNSDVSSLVLPAEFRIYYVPAAGNREGIVTVSNFRRVISECEQNCL